jgi:hypothetical protein
MLEYSIPDLSPQTVKVYEDLLAVEIDHVDPDHFWSLIHRNADKVPPKINLGQRCRLDKVDFYCKAYDLHQRGTSVKSIAVWLKSKVPTVKSALTKAKDIIGDTIEPWSEWIEHKTQCSVCQVAQYCDHGFQLVQGVAQQPIQGEGREPVYINMGFHDFVSVSDSGLGREDDFDSDGDFDPFCCQGKAKSLKADPAWSAWHDNYTKFEQDTEDNMDGYTANVPLFHPQQSIGGHQARSLTLHSEGRKMILFKRKEV